jgi:hypothetical protein
MLALQLAMLSKTPSTATIVMPELSASSDDGRTLPLEVASTTTLISTLMLDHIGYVLSTRTNVVNSTSGGTKLESKRSSAVWNVTVNRPV